MKTATEWAHEIDDYVEACMNEDTEYKGIGAFSPHPLEDFVEAIRQEQREACVKAVRRLSVYEGPMLINGEEAIDAIITAGKED